MASVEIEGIRYGYDEDGEGPLVLFGHGLTCDRHLFDAQVAVLRDRYRCVSIDWPGHGRTGFQPSGWTLDDLARHTVQLLARLGGEPAVLVGLSQGGMAFMRAAIDHPRSVRALVLVDTSARAQPPEHVAAVKANLDSLRGAPEPDRERFVRDFVVPGFFTERWRESHPDLVEREVQLRLSHDPQGYELAVRAVVDREPIDLERLASVRVPVLVIVGADDTQTPVDHSEELARTLPCARLVVIPASGHHTPIEQPGATSAAISSFLDSLD